MEKEAIHEPLLTEVDFKGSKINIGVYTDGVKNKKDILLLHGLGSNARELYEKVDKGIPNERLCAIDWLGHGRTTKLLRKEDVYDIDYMSDYMRIVIDHLIKNQILEDKFFIIAKSMSAIPLGYLYNDYKNHFKKIILITPAGFDKKMGYLFAFFSSFITRSIVLSWFFSFFVPGAEKRKTLHGNLRIKNWGEIVSRYARSGYDIFGNMKLNHIVRDKFDRTDKEILLICGKKDFIFPERNYLDFAFKHNWKVIILSIKEHNFDRENYKKSAEMIKDFIGAKE
jgi:pimeloyl-ACP methyl ester carboxylesterase